MTIDISYHLEDHNPEGLIPLYKIKTWEPVNNDDRIYYTLEILDNLMIFCTKNQLLELVNSILAHLENNNNIEPVLICPNHAAHIMPCPECIKEDAYEFGRL